jgi:MFS superfamily sulfate permease-like transporter
MTLQAPEQVEGFKPFVPGLSSITEGVRNSALADSRAALTVWAVVVPQSLAYATLAGVPSVNGLYAAVGALAIYALFGTCRDLNMGAESTLALMAAAAVAPLVTWPEDVIELSSLAALLVGGWCLLKFIARLGFISKFLSRPILAGYVFGSGIIIVLSQFESLFGLGIALLGYPDSFLTARSLASTGGYTLDANQEFLAVGASNVASGILQGIPVNGSQSRSFVQSDAGGKSNLVGLICAALVLATLFFLTGLFEKLPNAVLAGIVIVAGLGLFDIVDFKALWKIRRSEFWLGAATVAAVLGLDMLGGIAFAIRLSLIADLARDVRPHTAELGLVDGTDTFREIDRHDNANPIPGLLVYRIDDELFFANTAFFVRDVKSRLIESDPLATALAIDAAGVSDIDTTTLQQLEELLKELAEANADVAFAQVRQLVTDMIERAGLHDRVRRDAIFLEVTDAVHHFQSTRDTRECGER